MASTQLTARVSVRVQAKNASQTASQKRDTGGNIARALGNGDISDSLKDEIGDTTKPTIADENGNEWVAIEDIIAAGKKMYANGAFEEKTIYDGITDNETGEIYRFRHVGMGPFTLRYTIRERSTGKISAIYEAEVPSGVLYTATEDSNGVSTSFLLCSKTDFTCTLRTIIYDYNPDPQTIASDSTQTRSASAYTISINGVSYSAFYNSAIVTISKSYFNTEGRWEIVDSNYPDPGSWEHIDNATADRLKKYCIGTLFGESNTTGGSLIDWTKSDAEIEEDIRNLHETWDVSEHSGSYQSMAGTYFLAGAIEYNPADPSDPTQGPPGSVG